MWTPSAYWLKIGNICKKNGIVLEVLAQLSQPALEFSNVHALLWQDICGCLDIFKVSTSIMQQVYVCMSVAADSSVPVCKKLWKIILKQYSGFQTWEL